MEVYAGFLEHVDHHLGRLIDALEELEVLDDTLIYYIIGDNGASAEGTPNGCFNEMATLNGLAGIETPEFLASKIDDFGGPKAYNHYAVGWAHAMDTPYQWTKQVASHWGGTRNGTIVHWPKGIKAKGEVRSQFHHVIDVAPTILEAAGLPHPTVVNSVQQAPIEGVSMLYAFNDAKAAERHETQYFEMFCNRGIYHKGWTAVTRHGVPWLGAYKRALRRGRVGAVRHQHRLDAGARSGEGESEEARRAAAALPDRSGQVQRAAARRSDVRALQPGPRRPPAADQGQDADSLRRHGTADRELDRLDQEQVVLDHRRCRRAEVRRRGRHHRAGRQHNGWSLYAKGGKLKYCYNFFGITLTFVEATQPIPAGHHQVRMEFKYDGGGLAKGGDVTLYVDGKAGRPGPRRADRADGLLRRRDLRRRQGSRLAGVAGLRSDGQRVQRRGELGADRPREGRSRSHDLAGRALPRRDGAAVTIAFLIAVRSAASCDRAAMSSEGVRGRPRGAMPNASRLEWIGKIRGNRQRTRGGVRRHRAVSARRVAKRQRARVEAGRDGANDDQRHDERSGGSKRQRTAVPPGRDQRSASSTDRSLLARRPQTWCARYKPSRAKWSRMTR